MQTIYKQGQYLPSPREAHEYYYGLAGEPKLIARSSITPWTPKYCYSSRLTKRLTTIGAHPISQYWDQPKFRGEMKVVLMEMKARTVDMIRIGYEGEGETMQPTIWVGIESGLPTDSATIQNCVNRIHQIVCNYGISDVQCEAREIDPTLTGISKDGLIACELTQPEQDQYEELMLSFGWGLGIAIAHEDSPDCEGSLGMYFRGRNSHQIMGLTCQHVLYPRYLLAEGQEVNDMTRSTAQVLKPGNLTLDDAKKIISGAVQRAKQNQKGPSTLQPLEDKLQKIESFKTLASRSIGQVIESPRFGIHENDQVLQGQRIPESIYSGVCQPWEGDCINKWAQDWLLFEVDPKKIDNEDFPANTVYIGHIAEPGILKVLADVFDVERTTLRISYERGSANSLVRYLMDKDQSDEKIHIVGKRGRSSRTTWGKTNQLQSWTLICVLEENANGKKTTERCILSDYLCILPLVKEEVFARRGDSGSIAFDLEGKAVAMVTAVASDNGGPVYAQPIDWIVEAAESKRGELLDAL